MPENLIITPNQGIRGHRCGPFGSTNVLHKGHFSCSFNVLESVFHCFFMKKLCNNTERTNNMLDKGYKYFDSFSCINRCLYNLTVEADGEM